MTGTKTKTATNAQSDPLHPRRETWAVEVLDTAGTQVNSDTLAVVAADSSAENDKEVHVKLVNVTTSVPCGLGGSMPVSKVDAKTVKAHEVQVFKKHVAPLLSTSQGKKLRPKYIPVRNEKREEGLKEIVRKVGAQRLYVHTKKNCTLVEDLALEMPGGCTVIGMCQGKKATQVTSVSIDIYNSCGDGEPRLLSRDLSQGSFSCLGSETGSVDHDPRSTSIRVTKNNINSIEYFDSSSTPSSPAQSRDLPGDFANLGIAIQTSSPAGTPLSSLQQSQRSTEWGSLSAQFCLQRARSCADDHQNSHFSGPLPLMHRSSTCSPGVLASSPLSRSSTGTNEFTNEVPLPLSPSIPSSPLKGRCASSRENASPRSPQTDEEIALERPGSSGGRGRRESLGRRMNSATERGWEGGFRNMSRMMMKFGSAKER